MQKEITETLVSFKVAELAKKKGFRKSGVMMGYVTKFYRPSTQTLLSYGRTGRSKISDLIYAPSADLLQRWLREVHNIHFIVKPYIETLGKKEITGYYTPTICTSSLDEYLEFDDNYSSYEEALEEALFQALNLLPDVNI